MVIDDFSIPRAPYRLMTDMTFFCRAEAILRYVLTTSDPIRTEFTPAATDTACAWTSIETA